MAITIGVDIGQKRDPTAICVAEEISRQVAGRTETHYVVRYLGRVPLGTPYPKIARRLAEIVANARARSGSSPTVSVDATGVGGAVVDLLRERVRSGVVVPVTFTAGDRRTETWEDGYLRVSLGKSYLNCRLQSLLQTGRIHLPQTVEAEALSRELLDCELRVDHNGHESFGAFRTGTHDDLACALGLATQIDPW